jgi:hypothetical protein
MRPPSRTDGSRSICAKRVKLLPALVCFRVLAAAAASRFAAASACSSAIRAVANRYLVVVSIVCRSFRRLFVCPSGAFPY